MIDLKEILEFVANWVEIHDAISTIMDYLIDIEDIDRTYLTLHVWKEDHPVDYQRIVDFIDLWNKIHKDGNRKWGKE